MNMEIDFGAYIEAERRIAATYCRGSGIEERWAWGRMAIADRLVCNEAGNLRRYQGVGDRLVAAARSAECSLSRPEIHRRLRAARTYRTLDALHRAIRAGYASWGDLDKAGFPVVEDTDRDVPRDDRAEPEPPAPRGEVAVPLFTAAQRSWPLRAAIGYDARERAETERRAVVDRQMRAYLDRLIAAVNGDLNVSVATAAAVLAQGGLPDNGPQ